MNTSTHVVCRLLGGSGRAPLMVVPTTKLPALLAPTCSRPAGTIVQRLPLPMAA
jgi:hypothetical protein